MKAQSHQNTLIGISLLLLTGCTTFGTTYSQLNESEVNETMPLDPPRPDIVEIATEVGKSMGYQVFAKDKDDESAKKFGESKPSVVILHSDDFPLSFIAFLKIHAYGGNDFSSIEATSKDNGKTLDIKVAVYGNYGAGEKEVARKILTDFENMIMERLQQKSMQPLRDAVP